jgi:Ni2+-binding GTPase involved in maturation of urease and hydrogenase
MPSPVTHAPLQKFAQPTVVVVSGWGGSGKTKTIGRALQGLTHNITEVGVIINERNQGSVDIDLARLPKGFEKLGLHGCACCSQLSDVLAGIGAFRERGRKLTFIEQSPLSITSDITNALRQRRYDNIVVFVFNPAQFQNAPATHVQGIRDADVVLITHHQPGSEAAKRAERIIATARGDLSPVPVVVDNNPHRPFPAPLWQSMLAMRRPAKGGVLGAMAGLFGGGSKTSSDFQEERAAFVKNYSEITVRPYATDALAILNGVKALAQKGVELSRVKGSLANEVEIDIIQEGDRYKLEPGGGVESGGYLSLRSFKVQLSSHTGLIAAHLGTGDSSPSFVQQVVAGYPQEADLARSIASGNVPFGFESDRFLTDLRIILPFIQYIPDSDRQEELGNAFVGALKGSIETRLALLKALHEPSIEPRQKAIGLFNAYYALTDILCDPNLQMFAEHQTTAMLFAAMKEMNPAAGVISTVGKIPALRFEGRKDLARDEVRLFAQTLNRAKDFGYIDQDAIDATYSSLYKMSDPIFQTHKGALRS